MNIQDIARLAGVSASTVSKVMNGKDRDISEDTKKKVLKVIEEQNYIPYFKFREKEGLKNRLIGLIVRRENREREAITVSAEQAARSKGYGLVIRYADPGDDLCEYVEEMARKQVSGVMIDSEKKISCGRLESTAVYLNQTKQFDRHERVSFYYRLSEAGRMAAERLMKEGHQKSPVLSAGRTIPYWRDTGWQYRAIICRFSRRGPTKANRWSPVEKYGIRQCLTEEVTAVICGSADIACCVWKMMERTRTPIPDALSMIVVGDGPVLKLLGDGITAVRLPAGQMARNAAECLTEMIQAQKEMELMRKFSPEIAERRSIVYPAQEKLGEKIIVVGSMNMDVTLEASRIPVKGETQLAEKLYVFPGGKGANQAVGAGKLGGQVYMIGCLGNDMDGRELYTSLIENHVHMDGVLFDTALPSGKAYINVDQDGESTIVVYQGANRSLNQSQIQKCRYLFESAAYCLLSMEIPDEIVEYTIRICRRTGTKVILKPSATERMKEELYADVEYFIPNENELHLLVPGSMGIEEKARLLREKGVENVIVTLGARGCYLVNGELSMYFGGSGFEAVDTTGGADSFISALAVCLSEGKPLVQAVRFAIYASGITVTRYGVQPALPDRRAVDVYEDEIYGPQTMTEERMWKSD